LTPTCPLFQDTDCRFCSHEHLIIPYAPLVEDPRTHQLRPGLTEHRREMIGEMCNNVSLWVRDLTYCPARWGLTSFQNGKRAEGTGVYPDGVGQGMIVIDDEPRGVVVPGQQVLQID
jgi:hypothetical protein